MSTVAVAWQRLVGATQLHWSHNVARVLGFPESWQHQFHKHPQATGLEAGIEDLHIQEPGCKLLQHFDAPTLQHYKQPSEQYKNFNAYLQACKTLKMIRLALNTKLSALLRLITSIMLSERVCGYVIAYSS